MKKSKTELVLEVLHPDERGVSRWVTIKEIEKKIGFKITGNGETVTRKDGTLSKMYKIEKRRATPSQTSRVVAIRLNGFKEKDEWFNQHIRRDIWYRIIGTPSVVSGIPGTAVDHKNGRKNNPRVSSVYGQTDNDFQSLTGPENTWKRDVCKKCEATDCRFNALQAGIPEALLIGKGFTQGDEKYVFNPNNPDEGCYGCYWHDVKDFKEKTMKTYAEMKIEEHKKEIKKKGIELLSSLL